MYSSAIMLSKQGHRTYQVRKPSMKRASLDVSSAAKAGFLVLFVGAMLGLKSGISKPCILQPRTMMNPRRTAFAFVLLLLASTLTVPFMPSPEATSAHASHPTSLLEDAFVGFTTEGQLNAWNQAPWPSMAVPNGFDFLSVYDYSDVGVLINNNSEASRTIGWAFIAARNISQERVFIFDNTSAPTKETINREQFITYFAEPFSDMMDNRSNASEINYLVTTKGIPLRINGGNDKASFDQELSLLGGLYNSSVGSDYWVDHSYGPLAGNAMEAFSREAYGFFLVTRLTGYTVETALGLIEKANNSLGSRGTFALDLATNRNGSGYKFWNDDLYTANTSLNATMGFPTHFDETSMFLTNISNVMGYASWGSNDGSWDDNLLPNGGFDTSNSSTSSGSQHWEVTYPSLSSGDSFNWTLQNDVKQGGASAMEAAVAAECAAESGSDAPGIFAEFFDNAGVSFNAASMPSLIDRVPDHTRLESQLAYTSMNNAYPGLDNRFKNDWGARFSGLMDVPEDGNWTFYLTSDDGSEMWLNDSSLIQNYGSHGMREVSSTVLLEAGLHDFKVEFFQGGGPHGLTLQWEGPNQSKTMIPASAFTLAGDYVPAQAKLQHRWSFEDQSGMTANDSAQGGADFTLYNMNASNWRTCASGSCLWYDGVDDYLEVDVQDWSGNFTVSQWVWANRTTLPNYASVFAAGTTAGSNASFQHAVFNGEWRLHNNQTHAFGAVNAQNWTHLVTVFENGAARQYHDGVLTRTTQFPAGSVDEIESYRLGVNRAGSTYFEGMIDEVRIWNTSLSHGEVTALNRDIYLDCAAYSGNGQAAASVEQTFLIPQELQTHGWLASGFGMRTGDIFGTFEIKIEGLDANGTVVSTKTSSEKEFETTWASTTVHFEPHPSSVELRITLPLNLVATSTDGSVYLDTVKIYPIRPSNQWINGSIAETAVSTGGRSFEPGTAYGQSLIADLLEDGVSGVKGYVYEPYLTAVGLSSVLMTSYASGYNLAESHAAANLQSSWMGVTVGDPKMAPYADRFHDINIIDARIPANASFGQNTTVQLLIENKGMAGADGALLVQDIQGNVELFSGNFTLPAGDALGSYAVYNLTIVPEKTGWMDLRIRYTASGTANERILDNNQRTLRVWINAPPVVDAVYCDASTYARGDTFICTVEASDDVNVTSVDVAWTVVEDPTNLTTAHWVHQSLGTSDAVRWQTSIILPTNLTLGFLVMEAVAMDESNQSGILLVRDVAEVVDAQAQWFGPHVEGVDSEAWSGATPLPYAPNGGFVRGQSIQLKTCVLDADHDPESELPELTSSRGTVSALTHQPQLDSNHHCYVGLVALWSGESLQKVSFEVRSGSGSLLSSRLVGVRDIAPSLSIELIDGDGASLDRVRGGGGEYLRLTFMDGDDPNSSVTGDIMILWPGGSEFQLPLDVVDIRDSIVIELASVESALESGQLAVSVDATGRHGALIAVEQTFTFMLTPPLVVETSVCGLTGVTDSLRFGETLTLYAHIESERSLEVVQASMSQLGWSVAAPQLSMNDVSSSAMRACLAADSGALGQNEQLVAFRLRLDGSYIDGAGQILLVVKDIDGLSTSALIPIQFFHAAPSLSLDFPSNATAGDRLEPTANVLDLDGLEDVECQGFVANNGTLLANFSLEILTQPNDPQNGSVSFAFPTTKALNNATLELNFTCIDSWGQQTSLTALTLLEPMPPCINCNSTQAGTSTTEGSDSMKAIALGFVALFVLGALSTGFLLRRKEGASTPPLWELDDPDASLNEAPDSMPELTEGSAIPEGWSPEAYHGWLNGPMPDGWERPQWDAFKIEQEAFFVTGLSEDEGKH
jgi:uncharacterized protein (TIGR03790 family)